MYQVSSCKINSKGNKMNIQKVNFLRVRRPLSFQRQNVVNGVDISGSWMTVELETPLYSEEVDKFMCEELPGWELQGCSVTNPGPDFSKAA